MDRKDGNSEKEKGSSLPNYQSLLQQINEKLAFCPDIVKKQVFISENTEAYFFYISGITDADLVQRDFIQPILSLSLESLLKKRDAVNLPGGSITFVYDLKTFLNSLFSGSCIFLGSGLGYALAYSASKFDKRSIDEPAVEKNIRGSHEGFIESLDTNLSILRRRIKNPSLKFKVHKLGTTTNQRAVIAYIDGIANPKILSTLEEKIKKVNYDGLLAVGYIEQAITDFPHSPFPQYLATERPDKVTAALLEGRLAILLEGTPVVILAPVSFFSFFQALDDYSTQWMNASFLRMIRILSLFTALFLPSLYIAITSYHYYAVPLDLLIPLAESRSRIPFPPIVEVIMLEATVEMVREAAIRLPTYIGTSISVVAGLIIGEAAVDAGVVSNLLIVIVASTAIASYVIPSYDMGLAIRILRFIFLLASGIFGIIGIIVCASFFLAHVSTIESLGQPYYQPFLPFKPKDLKDSLIRMPLGFLRKRPGTAKPSKYKRGQQND